MNDSPSFAVPRGMILCSHGIAWGDVATWVLAALALAALIASVRLLNQERQLFLTLNTAWLDFEGEGKVLARYDEKGIVLFSIKNFGSVVATNISIDSIETRV